MVEQSLMSQAAITTIVNDRNAAISAIVKQLEAINHLDAQLRRNGIVFDYNILRWTYSSADHVTPHIVAMVDRQLWQRVMNESGLDDLLDRERLRSFEQRFTRNPEAISAESIAKQLRHFESQLDDVLADRLKRAYWLMTKEDAVRGSSFPNKWILPGVARESYMSEHIVALFHDIDAITAQALGQPIPGTRDDGTLVEAMRDGQSESAHWRIKVFSNGNAHLTPKDPALVAALNKLLGQMI